MATHRQKLAATRITFKQKLMLAGTHKWTREKAIRHLDEEVERQQKSLPYGLLGDSFLTDWLGIRPYDNWATMPVYIAGVLRNNFYYKHGTWRSDTPRRLPKVAQEMIRRILELAPDTRFQVSFIGRDPVLWAVPPHDVIFDNRVAVNAQPIYVWVGRGWRAKTVAPPR